MWISLEDNLLYHKDPREMLQPRGGRAELRGEQLSKSPASPLPAAALQTPGLLARHRRNVWSGTEVEVTETQWPGFAPSQVYNCSVIAATQRQKRKKNDRKS